MSYSNKEEYSDTGFFIGSALAFSDGILRHTASEFPFVRFIRLATIEDLLGGGKDETKHCCVIIVDESQANELAANIESLFETFEKARVALSYRQIKVAQDFLQQGSEINPLSQVGILPMRLEIDHWAAVLRLIMGGERYVPYELLEGVREDQAPAASKTATKEPKRLAQLTERERQILTSVSEGKQNKIIAAELDLSEHTVKLHIHNVISKLGVNNRTEAAVCYLAEQPKTNGWA